MKYPSGDCYAGNWKAGKSAGHGEMKYANGDVYAGGWEDNQPMNNGAPPPPPQRGEVLD